MREYLIRFKKRDTPEAKTTKTRRHTFAEAEVEANRLKNSGAFDGSPHDWRIVSITEVVP